MVEMTATIGVETRATRSNSGDNYTAGLMVHEIARGGFVAPRQKATNTMRLSINNSTK